MQGWHIAPETVETCAPAPDFLNDCAREAAEKHWFFCGEAAQPDCGLRR